MIQPKVVYDKRKEFANGNSLSEYDWNLGKKTLLDTTMKYSFLESVIESIIEREETFEYGGVVLWAWLYGRRR